ncbi:hypothetical protein EST38_g5621 [Candolleomyces aberdarensis]|uniref:Protein kinase domain-containing protein n=1 Tax=Candolleomyces aberdarensis TaxID=2316362 RepID=A0A4Q2DLV8_9AGAR|nr:hypothetical protein EST38_g5621 [Candolleomyces aberdarensis]
MTRTARAAHPRAVMKDRSESRSGLDSSLRKGGAGGHNWGSLSDERQLETDALEDEKVEFGEAGREQDVVEDMSSKDTRSSPPVTNLSEDELKQARKYRKGLLNKKDVDLSAIARTSAAASTSPPNPSGFTKRLANSEKQAPPSTTDVDCIYLTAWKLDGLTANLKKDELATRISNTNFLTDAFELEGDSFIEDVISEEGLILLVGMQDICGHNASWPFGMLAEVVEEGAPVLYSYRPKSDFLVMRGGLPRLIVEVDSQVSCQDRIRMLLQGVSVVRFANEHLDAFRKEKNFILVAIFIYSDGSAERSILYQDKTNLDCVSTTCAGTHTEGVADRVLGQVHHRSRTFKLTGVTGSILEFALELYNLLSMVEEAAGLKTESKIQSLRNETLKFVQNEKLQSFTSERPDPPGDRAEQGSAKRRKKWNGGGIAEQELEEGGYKVKPTTYEDEIGGVWEEVHKPSSENIWTVYPKSGDKKRTALIAKRISNSELEILQFLHTAGPSSPHILTFIDNVIAPTNTYVIFPKLNRIHATIKYGPVESLRSKIEQWCRGLVDGVAYLHAKKIAHLDIKPDNLVYGIDGQLKIIDFDCAKRLEDEEEEIIGYRGTPGWTAPEMGEADGVKQSYSAIRADRWSCGLVLKLFLESGAPGSLLTFSALAGRLTVGNPSERPSLIEWCSENGTKRLDTEAANEMGDMDGAGVRLRRKCVESDEVDGEEPITKKAKVDDQE